MRIAVLCGGVSEEREVSLRSGACVAEALRNSRHTVREFALSSPYPSEQELAVLRETDAVFLALHGGVGENGALQMYLERAGISHYTGSDPVASALAMDKYAAKACVARYGVPVARGFCLLAGENTEKTPPVLPLIVKPVHGGSSIGLCRVDTKEAWRALAPDEPLLCEEYLPGREFSVAVLEGHALPPVEICPVQGTYDYHNKYTKGAVRELCPAPLSTARLEGLRLLAESAFRALGLRDYGRIDFKDNATGEPIFLEANTLPGMTQTSLFPLAASRAGYNIGALCTRMARLAAKRHK